MTVSRETGRVVAVVNQKGGVGKSTTTVNLGASLAVLGKRVLVVDLDPQGNTTTGLGIDKRQVGKCVYDVLLHRAAAGEVLFPTEIPGLEIIPATLNLAGAEIELVSALSRETRLRSALDALAPGYDYVLIDCPPSLGLLTINALTAANWVIIPVQAEYYALEGLAQLTTVLGRVREALNPPLQIMGVLVTMVDARTNLSVDVIDEVSRFFPALVFRTRIPRNVRLSEAPSFGKPAILFDAKSRGAQAYLALAKEVLGDGEELHAEVGS
ncbi:MAG TPA: AAA family ATPase [Candidatus Dormibacteraeota bacterium]|nr:AAA family ATPase [Candidatus Dormibacteraeota bacterium]